MQKGKQAKLLCQLKLVWASVLDGKMIIENSLMSFTKAVTKDFGLFEAFRANKDPRDRDLTKKGTFNKELRVRYAFRDNLIQIPRSLAGRD